MPRNHLGSSFLIIHFGIALSPVEPASLRSVGNYFVFVAFSMSHDSLNSSNDERTRCGRNSSGGGGRDPTPLDSRPPRRRRRSKRELIEGSSEEDSEVRSGLTNLSIFSKLRGSRSRLYGQLR